MSPTPSRLSRHARLAVFLAAAWLLAGALFKLFSGSPKLLPPLIREHTPFDWDLTFHLAIAIELSLVFLAVCKPHLGWAPLLLLFAVFEVVLADMLVAGAESCGCFGETITISPAVMMGIDGVLFVAIVLTRPWQTLSGPGLPTLLLVAGLAASWVSPWLVIPSQSAVPQVPIVGDGTVTGPSGDLRYAVLNPTAWKGKSVFDIAELKRWVREEQLPIEGSIVLWRQSCPHCAEHLRAMVAKDDGSRQILLIQARDDLKNAREVDALPSGAHVQTFAFPENLDCAFTTPCEVVVEGGTVSAVLYEADFKKP